MDFITPFTPALAEAFLLVMVCVILLVDVFLADAQRWIRRDFGRPRHDAG